MEITTFGVEITPHFLNKEKQYEELIVDNIKGIFYLGIYENRKLVELIVNI